MLLLRGDSNSAQFYPKDPLPLTFGGSPSEDQVRMEGSVPKPVRVNMTPHTHTHRPETVKDPSELR